VVGRKKSSHCTSRPEEKEWLKEFLKTLTGEPVPMNNQEF
jgi:hypothetical protein